MSDIGILNQPGDVALLAALALAPVVLAGLLGAYVGWRVARSRRFVIMGAAAGIIVALAAYAVLAARALA